MKKSLFIGLAVLIGIIALAIAAKPPRTAPAPAGENPENKTIKVVASFYPLAHFASLVGGGQTEVVNIAPPGVEPHDFEPTPQDLVSAQSSDIFLFNGVGFDPWAEKLAQKLEKKGVNVFNASTFVQLLANKGEEAHEGEESEKEEHGAYDPHFWLDPVIAQELVSKIGDVFANADPAHAETYRANTANFNAKLRSLDDAYRTGLTDCRLREAVASHAAFGYLANRYNLAIASISGLSPDEEPSPRTMAEITNLAKEKGIQYIFFETLVSPKLAETIAQEVGAKTLVFNPLEGLTPEEEAQGATYISIMEQNLANLRTALSC